MKTIRRKKRKAATTHTRVYLNDKKKLQRLKTKYRLDSEADVIARLLRK